MAIAFTIAIIVVSIPFLALFAYIAIKAAQEDDDNE